MRHSLKPVLARVERLVSQMRPAPLDPRRMTDGELECEIVRLAERAAGPPTQFPTADAYVTAVLDDFLAGAAAIGRTYEGEPAITEPIRDHWERARWFQEHAGHGRVEWFQDPAGHSPLVFAKTWYSPGLMVTCSCGANLKMYRELVPAEFQDLMRRQTEADRTERSVHDATRVGNLTQRIESQ